MNARSLKTEPARNIRRCAAEQGVSEEEARKRGMDKRSKDFVKKGEEVCAKV